MNGQRRQWGQHPVAAHPPPPPPPRPGGSPQQPQEAQADNLPRATYNPQSYASAPVQSPSSNYASYAYPPAPPPRTFTSNGPRPYNPAAYHDNSFVSATSVSQGQASPGISQSQFAYPTSPTYASQPYESPSLNSQAFDPQPQYGPRMAAVPPHHSTYAPSSSAPLPSQPFPHSPPALPPRNTSQSPGNTFYRHSPPAQPQYLSPQPQEQSPSPDLRDHDTHSPSLSDYRSDQTRYDTPTSTDQSPYYSPNPVAYEPGRSGVTHRHNSAAHPRSRPLPGLPPRGTQYDSGSESGSPHENLYGDQTEQDHLFDEVEHAIMATSAGQRVHADRRPGGHSRQQSSWSGNAQASNGYEPNGMRDDRNSSQMDSPSYDEYGDDSDAEAAAGLEAMRMAEEQEANDVQRHSMPAGLVVNGNHEDHRQSTVTEDDDLSDEDYTNVDMGMYGGGYEVPLHYGGEPSMLVTSHSHSNSFAANHPSGSSRGSVPTDRESLPLRTSSSASATGMYGAQYPARVDEAGTGGFADPNTLPTRKMSFDEDDERAYLDSQTSQGFAETPGFPEPHYQRSQSHRPLPSLPPGSDQQYYEAADSLGMSHYTSMPEPGQFQQYANAAGVAQFPYGRSQSVGHPSSTQQTLPPLRAKTDAEERQRRSMLRATTYGHDNISEASTYQSQAGTHLGLDAIALPTGRRFQPSKLTSKDYDRCTEPWALSGITTWIRSLADTETELKENIIDDALVNLLTHKNPNMNIADAENLSAQIIRQMYGAGTLVHEEEWLRFGPETTTGVFYQLTGKGCYAPSLHEHEPEQGSTSRCYSYHCQRTVKKLSLADGGTHPSADWATFYGMKKEDLESVDKKQIELQNNLHEIVQAEELYLIHLSVLRTLYRDALQSAQPPIMSPKNLTAFIDSVFGKLEAVEAANRDYLLPQLKYRQQEQGPWVTGFSDIFRDWIRKAKVAYTEYAANSSKANLLVRQEKEKNMLFRAYLDNAQKNVLAKRLSWDHYLKVPITKIQRYSLMLSVVEKNMKQESEEKANLQTAIEEIKVVTKECDERVAEANAKVALLDLSSRLILRPDMKRVDLNLTQWGREILYQGELQRTGTSKFTWLDTTAILLDNYLVLAKSIPQKDATSGGRTDKFDVSKMPIPMDLLMLESRDDDPVIKSKGLAPTQAVTPKTPVATDARTARVNSIQTGRPSLSKASTTNSLSQTQTNASDKSFVATTNLEGAGKDDKIMYPFRARHLGREVYTLYATKEVERDTWCDKIIEAKTRHAASLFAQNAEPFKVNVIADSAFAYDTWSGGQKAILIKGTPLNRALHDVEKAYAHSGQKGPVCRARVNCATTFSQPSGTQMIAIGTDYGVYIAEAGSPRAWSKAIQITKVTQIAVLEDFNVIVLISDKSLIAYHLDVNCPPSGSSSTSTSSTNDSIKKAPQKLSGARDIGFFSVGRMKDRTLVFYKKRDGISSTFKILEPIYQRSTEKKRHHFLMRGHTDFFREYDDFYIPVDCIALDLFSTSLAVATSKGFEVLNLDKKTPWTVPDLKAPHVQTIAARLHNMEPLAMFRLAADGSEFLCVYEECAVYVNKHGDISRSVVMEFVGHARQACLVKGFLVLFDADFVEVRDALNGRLKQVIAGRDVRCLDNARSGIGVGQGERTIKFALQHPEQERTQLVVELVANRV
ncbi:MAG: hypothetical protein M1828_000252 [Chrysothrix sp. TS-e1954]|nr:MAG: hypothetical protein M1828_000252 [Chrysothrix sp. TS-e1954]